MKLDFWKLDAPSDYVPAIVAVLSIAILAGAFSAGWGVNGWRKDAEIAYLKAEKADDLARMEREKSEALLAANSESKRLQDIKDEALRKANQRAAQNQSAADSARSELDRLRDDIAASDRATPAIASGTDAATTARALLAECAARYSNLAEKADRHATDAVTLYRSWPK